MGDAVRRTALACWRFLLSTRSSGARRCFATEGAARVCCDWPGAKDAPALFLNQRGHRLSAKGAHDVITGIADRGGLDDHVTAHVLRHSFATTLVRGGTDLVIVAELLGHARLETTRVYTRPTAEDRSKAVDLLPVDQ